jgi:hypothetical protein
VEIRWTDKQSMWRECLSPSCKRCHEIISIDRWMSDAAVKIVWLWCNACNFASLSFMLISHPCSSQISSV